MDDLYYLVNESPETNAKIRPVVKPFLLMMLNASSEAKAVSALRMKHYEDKKRAIRLSKMPSSPPFLMTVFDSKLRKDYVPPPFAITVENLHPIAEQLYRQHQPIAHYFCTGIGNTLMYYDSVIAEEVMPHFAAKGVAVLPIHDSFVLEIRYAEECWDVMKDTFAKLFGIKIPVDVIDIKARTDKILAGSRVSVMGSDWKELDRWLTREIKADF